MKKIREKSCGEKKLVREGYKKKRRDKYMRVKY